MGDLRPEAQRGDPRGGEGRLDRCGHTGRHLEGRPGVVGAHQLRSGGGDGQAGAAGVGDSGGVGPEAHQPTHAEPLAEPDHSLNERPPVVVRFRSAEDEHVTVVAVTACSELDDRPVDVGVDAVDDVQRRSMRPIVEQELGVELRQLLGPGDIADMADGGSGAPPRVDPAVEVDQQHWIDDVGGAQHSIQMLRVDSRTHWCSLPPNRWEPGVVRRCNMMARNLLGKGIDRRCATLHDTMADVTDSTFDRDVVQRSKTIPVVVDLWAQWCGPCKQLTPILEKVVAETNGAVELAKIDIDANPAVGQAFKVQSIPAVYAMVDGQAVDGFMGAQGEPQVREFVARLVPAPEQSEVERLVAMGDEESLVAALRLEPDNPAAVTALAELLVARGEAETGLQLLERIPESAETRRITALARTGGIGEDVEEILAELLATVKTDDEARMRFLDLLEALGPDDPRSALWRRKLSTALF